MHRSEIDAPLPTVESGGRLSELRPVKGSVSFIILPYFSSLDEIPQKQRLYADLEKFMDSSDGNATIAVLASPLFAADFCSRLKSGVHLKLWVAVKLETPLANADHLSQQHCALLVFTKYSASLRHAKTRIGYTYCPTCDKTTKDYGGKKHLYHEFGTIISDVWRDITVGIDKYPVGVINRLADLFSIPEYSGLIVCDQRKHYTSSNDARRYAPHPSVQNRYSGQSALLNGDCIGHLRSIPDNSMDFCFADPPYNLKKNYESWDDAIDIQNYFDWCDEWLGEAARVLKPGRTLAVLNIPNWCIRHFRHLVSILDYQDWIAWEGLSFPVRMIMPAHYSILCFSKGRPRPLPALGRRAGSQLELQACHTLKEEYCARPACMARRRLSGVQDSEFVSNLWFNVHRLKHNSRRMDHPCQLPPMLMHRIISLFTHEDEFVLDPFNGVGTTTLSAQQLGRKYVGIELSEYYHGIAVRRHSELSEGFDPFRKRDGATPNAKNSPVGRLEKQKYRVSKKALQMEIKAIAKQIGRVPSRDDIRELSRYPPEYFDDYFINWSEVTAAARTTGMSEVRTGGRAPSAHSAPPVQHPALLRDDGGDGGDAAGPTGALPAGGGARGGEGVRRPLFVP